MYEYRQVIYRMRLGESDRAIAKAGLIGRRKAAELRQLAKALGWLEKGPLPEDSELAVHFGKKPVAATSGSLVLPYATRLKNGLKTAFKAPLFTRLWNVNMALAAAINVFGSFWRP
jgi:hypothetical protein